MLSELAQFESLFGPLRLFRFITFRSVGGAATALFLGMMLAPWLIARLRQLKANQSFRSREEVGQLADLHADKKRDPDDGWSDHLLFGHHIRTAMGGTQCFRIDRSLCVHRNDRYRLC